MEHTKIVTPNELEDFADRRDSEPVIPELIFLLVNLSVPELGGCRIPYGDEIGLPGLDGLVQTELGFRQFVPKKKAIGKLVVAKMRRERQRKITRSGWRKPLHRNAQMRRLSS
jgi:hypothetical protein